MAFEVDDEILHDFIIEAGEILELLSEQLVQLEKNPADTNLLNAIFRGFHTIKGGAGFLSLNNLVNICHISENVFDILRHGKRTVDAALMDVILKAVDAINNMFATVKNGEIPEPAEKSILVALELLAKEVGEPVKVDIVEAKKPELAIEFVQEPIVIEEPSIIKAAYVSHSKNDDITDAEFEQLLDCLHGSNVATNESRVDEASLENNSEIKTDSDFITDDEFETLLDELAKKAKHNTTANARDPFEGAQASEIKTTNIPAVKVEIVPDDAPNITNQTTVETIKKDSKSITSAMETTVRVDTNRLDQIMNMVGELVLVRNRLVKLKNNTNNEDIIKTIGTLNLVTADLQVAVMKTRMQPIKKVFGRFPRVVRDLARSLQKEIILEMIGEETDLDKNLVEALADPLVHLVRNSVDHGIETPNVRTSFGKSKTGKITLSAAQAGDHIVLSIEDDGQGMDPEVLRRIAIEKGVISKDLAERLNANECFELIFIPGFSTKKEVSDISGRGVGMDVVKTKINQLNGSIEILSTKGKGSTINIKIPLTLAILPTLMVVVGQQPFALPLSYVNEIFDLNLDHTNVVDGQLVVVVRDKAIPLFYLREWLLNNKNLSEQESLQHVVVVTIGLQKIGFVVDKLLGQEEVVIKALGDMLHGTVGVAGATITGDGNIAMILDVPNLLKKHASQSRKKSLYM